MNNIQIKTKVIANRIVEEVRRLTLKNIDPALVADTVREILEDESLLDAMASVAWDQDGKKGVCAFTPEQLLELSPTGFNPCPIARFVSGEVDLRGAIGFCFEQTFSQVWDDECWAENTGVELPEFELDLFQVTIGNSKEDQWLATDGEGNPLRELCPECREKAGKKPDLKVVKN